MDSYNTIEYYVKKCELNNNKGYYCIIDALKKTIPILSYGLNKISTLNIEIQWRNISQLGIFKKEWDDCYNIAVKYYNNFSFI